jgi:hypothetical protein
MCSSKVINRLKTVKERLAGNYSTEQLLDTLDELLMRGMEPIIGSTNFLDSRIICIATWYSTNQRRKLSPMEKGHFIASSIAYMLADTRTKMRIYRKMSIERNLSVMLMEQWLKLAGECVNLELRQLTGFKNDIQDRIDFLHWQLGTVNRHALFHSYQTVKYYLSQAVEFRNQIAEKYMRMVTLEAVGYHKQQTSNNGPRMQLDDVAQNFMIAVYKAIDKCDSNKGTLTSYVQKWITNAKTTNTFRHETGIAYTIPSGQRKQLAIGSCNISNYTLSMDSEEVKEIVSECNQEEEMIRADTINSVRLLAKAVDTLGLGRLSLGILEVLNDSEILLLKSAAIITE